MFAKGVTHEKIFLPLMSEVVSGNILPWAIGDIMGEHGLYLLGCLVLTAHGTCHIVCYVSNGTGSEDHNMHE